MANEGNLTIIELTAENFMRLKAVRLAPDPEDPVVYVTGENGAGKTAVLNILSATIGGQKLCPDVPIREGEDTAHTSVDLGSLKIERFWKRGSRTRLKVSDASGNEFRSSQSMLDELKGELSFDPYEFIRMKAPERVAMLLQAVGMGAKLAEMANVRAQHYDARTGIGRDVRRLEAQIEGIEPIPNDTPNEIVSVADLSAELEAATDIERHRDEVGYEITKIQSDILSAESNQERKQEEINELESKILSLRKEIESIQSENERRSQHLVAIQAEFNDTIVPDMTIIREKIATAEGINENVRRADRLKGLEHELVITRSNYENETKEIDRIDNGKLDVLKKAADEIGIAGLSVGDDDVLLDGLPLSSASEAAKLRLSVAVAMALNPKLRVIRIQEGSLLDRKSMEIIRELVTENEFQVWVEKVDDSGEIGFYIENGEVVA